MGKWFTEDWTENVRFQVRIKEHLYSAQTKYQKLDIYDSFDLGRFFTLDDYIMVVEKDEFIYHEMMIHVPMSVNPEIKNVLVIGGGDGGSVRELAKYPRIKKIDMVEIDEEVVLKCEEHFKFTACNLRDERVTLFFMDGSEYVKNCNEKYDLIVVDSTDPIGPGEGLFTYEFYQNCYNLLSGSGILVNQHESPYFDDTKLEMKRAHKKIKSIFEIAKVYQAFIPTYASGHWLFGFASKKLHPIKDFKSDVQSNLKLKYYNNDVHLASFALPNYVKDELKDI